MPQDIFKDLLDHLLEGCQIIDRSWQYVYLNDAAAHHGQRAKEELVGRTMMEAYPGIEHTELFARLRQAMEHGASSSMENEFEFPNGSKGWFELRIEPVPAGIFILSLDITERRKIDQIKSDFLSMASHQLTTPLSSTKLLLELFMKEPGLTKEHLTRVGELQDSNERLIALVNDLLRVSKIDAGKLAYRPEHVPVASAIRMAMDMLRPRSHARFQELAAELPPEGDFMHADPGLFRDAFEHILTDAIEYGDMHSTVTVRAMRKGDFYEISVHDVGLVIHPEDAEHIFTKFYRAIEAERMAPNSSGLGLFIAKSAAIANGGQIWFESDRAAGTTFYFTVPAADAAVSRS